MKALLIIDIQNDYFEQGSMTLVDSDKACNNARLLLERFRQNNEAVIHIQHIASRPTATFFLPDSIGADIHPDVQPLETEKVIIKHYPNSFRATELEYYLQEKGIKQLVICGMMTQMCVDSTTRAAKDFGYECTIIADACATKDLEILGQKIKADDVQMSFLAALEYFYATITTTEDFLNQ